MLTDWKTLWRVLRIIAAPAGAAFVVSAYIYAGLVDGVVLSCTGMRPNTHCRWASIEQEPYYVQQVVDTWWCLLAICLLCCYVTYRRALSSDTGRRRQ